MELGDKLWVKSKLVRRFAQGPKPGTERKVWGYEELPKPVEGIVVGLRTMSDGIRDWISSDEGYNYIPTDYFLAVVVAYHLRRKHIMLKVSDLGLEL